VYIIEADGTARFIARLERDDKTRKELMEHGFMLAAAPDLFVQTVRFSECLESIPETIAAKRHGKPVNYPIADRGPYTAEGARAAGFAYFNGDDHLCVDVPDESFTVSCRTSEGRRITFAFLPYKENGPPQAVVHRVRPEAGRRSILSALYGVNVGMLQEPSQLRPRSRPSATRFRAKTPYAMSASQPTTGQDRTAAIQPSPTTR
jgi:hypothetical protein